MRTKLSLQKISFFIGLTIFSLQTSAQCKGFVKRADFSALAAFEYCGNVRAAKMYSGDEAKLNQKVEVGKRYRIVMNNQKFLGDVNISIKDEKGKALGSEVVSEDTNYWEVMVTENQTIYIYLKAPKEESTIGIASSGCVALAVGELDNEELVVYP